MCQPPRAATRRRRPPRPATPPPRRRAWSPAMPGPSARDARGQRGGERYQALDPPPPLGRVGEPRARGPDFAERALVFARVTRRFSRRTVAGASPPSPSSSPPVSRPVSMRGSAMDSTSRSRAVHRLLPSACAPKTAMLGSELISSNLGAPDSASTRKSSPKSRSSRLRSAQTRRRPRLCRAPPRTRPPRWRVCAREADPRTDRAGPVARLPRSREPTRKKPRDTRLPATRASRAAYRVRPRLSLRRPAIFHAPRRAARAHPVVGGVRAQIAQTVAPPHRRGCHEDHDVVVHVRARVAGDERVRAQVELELGLGRPRSSAAFGSPPRRSSPSRTADSTYLCATHGTVAAHERSACAFMNRSARATSAASPASKNTMSSPPFDSEALSAHAPPRRRTARGTVLSRRADSRSVRESRKSP